MTFSDVENARLAFIEKKNKVKKKAIWIVLGVEFLFVLITVGVNIQAVQRVFANIDSNFTPMLIMPLLMLVVFMVILPAVVVAIVIAISTHDELTNYKKAYKGYFVERELNKTFSDIKYSHDAGLDENILASTGMIYTGDRYTSNDLTIGKYKNVNFAQADVHMEEEYKDDDGDTHYRTIFLGRFMIFEFPKKFKSRMMLSHYGSPCGKSEGKLNFMETESVEFNKAFALYAEDGMEAFYILTPDFMERVQELGRSHNDEVSIYFAENKMIVAINDGDDVFEPPSPSKPLDENAEATKIANEINLATNIVDNLKLSREV